MTQEAEGSYLGFYINLDRSEERRRVFEQQLAVLGLQSRYVRFPAVDGKKLSLSKGPLKPGEIGVFFSHCRALEAARHTGKCIHILEDDAILSRHTVPVIDEAVAANVFEKYDLLFTDMWIHCHVGFMKYIKSEFDAVAMPASGPLRYSQMRIFDLAKVFHAAFQSYVVGAKSIDRVIDLYRQEIQRGPTIPVDIFIQQQVLAGNLRAACLFPCLTSFRLEDVAKSTIQDQGEMEGQPSLMVMSALRYLFFVDCDMDYAERILGDAMRTGFVKSDRRSDLMALAAKFVLSDNFVGT